MKALVKTEAGEGALELRDVPIPDIGPDDIRIEVAVCGICGSDLHIEAGTHPCDPPVVLGHEFSGIVDAVGENVDTFDVGDRVGYRRPWNPFPGVGADGGFARYVRAPAANVWRLPDDISFAEATQYETVIGPMTWVRETAGLETGERVVVSGPGPIGLLVANIAKMDGASSVVVLGTDADVDVRLATAETMGADETFVFGEEALAAIEAEPPTVWFDTSGAPPAIEAAVDHVAPGGRVVCNALGDGPWNIDMRRVAYHSIQIRGRWGGDSDTLPAAVEAIQAGDLHVSDIITDTLPLTEWETAFERLREKRDIKLLLDPSR
ncbi:zinc-binding dehydrogenase [Haloarchaeobius sp. HME9146]|uniref:zinc-dependent alcohol dehydrogenase n=1 Tax=Haloarchaeobius sp. HME9146 TaxID=2978732 RepID=UPI0021BFD1CE|nr:alcohol dehydrogenase catalytic domain-containing protein [Haloarchaeobius sp. HME9146]MCT9098046.1 alcohol dehydrogenase catalytic domain-containing protein [Haloarchaeobius sp. HME9146]